MTDQPDIERDLKVLAAELRRLEAEYTMYFAGRLPRPPWETRGRVEAIIKRWDRAHIQSAADRFRFTTLQTRYATYAELWDRALRAREEGRPGPFARGEPKPRVEEPPAPRQEERCLVSFVNDPRYEEDKLLTLYESLMDARREAGEDVVPFHKFAHLVNDQTRKLREAGSREVAFRVVVREGRVVFTVRGTKEG